MDTELKNFGFVSGEHDNSSLPLIPWSPGRGAGNLIKVSKESPLRDWRGNLLVAHMGTRQFHRLIIGKNMVVHDEEIQLNYRVRDFLLTERGILVISTDEGLLFALQTYSSKLD